MESDLIEELRYKKIMSLHRAAMNHYEKSMVLSNHKNLHQKQQNLMKALYLEKEAAFLELNQDNKTIYFQSAANIACQLQSINEIRQLMEEARIHQIMPEISKGLEKTLEELEKYPAQGYQAPWYIKLLNIFE